MSRYTMMIGLEVHIELRTRTKMFCSCSAEFGGEPNTKICPVCAGLPGMLPAVNQDAVMKGLVLARELHGNIGRISRFDRKNYFYPDNPKSYQITQHYQPLSLGGGLKVGERWIRIHEIHLEEDAGKLIHTTDGRTLVNLNRAGVPLAEIVTEPDFRSPDEVITFLEILKDIAVYSGISDGRMQEGSLRADVNLSLKDNVDNNYGTRTEMKNLNSFTEIRHAILHEASRQEAILAHGMPVIRETRRWDEDRQESFSMRGKEDAPDYRYFPEPDLYSLKITDEMLQEAEFLRRELRPEKEKRYREEFGLSAYDARVLTEDPETAALFETTALQSKDPKNTAAVISTEVLRLKKETGITPQSSSLTPEKLSLLLQYRKSGSITGSVMKELLSLAYQKEIDLKDYIREHGLMTVRDDDALNTWVEEVILEQAGPVQEYLSGKDKVLTFLLGQVMRKARGRADADIVRKALIQKLRKT